jgi:haloacetate dehalogenase
VTNASVFDYQSGATTDYQYEEWDVGNGTMIEIPTHIMYSVYNLGQYDVQGIWSNYTAPSADLTTKGVGGGRGHFIIEEAPGRSFSFPGFVNADVC